MAAIPLNKFRTITHTITDAAVGIYTSFTVKHSRESVDTELVRSARVPHQDAMSFIDGRLVMETGDILKIEGDQNNTMKCIISILENAK